jgi:hypothetical protein
VPPLPGFVSIQAFARLDKCECGPFFIHSGHQTERLASRKPRNHAGVFHNFMINLRKERRTFFGLETKKASAHATYRAFVQAVHNVIHKDCGQKFGVG